MKFFSMAMLALCVTMGSVTPEEIGGESFSGFLNDYSKLLPVEDDFPDLLYTSPGYFEKIPKYTKAMIDQPEILISRESPYMGMKPDDMKALAESLRKGLTTALKDTFQIVEEPGKDVLYVRMGVTEMVLKKKRRRITSYTPTGAVLHAAKKALTKDFTKKINLLQMDMEMEIWDSQTSEILSAGIAHRGILKNKATGQKAEPATWDDLDKAINRFGKNVACRVKNSRLPEDQRVKCDL